MSGWVPVNKEHHSGRGWRRFRDYEFAQTTPLVDLALAETRKAAIAMPFAFRKVGTDYAPAAIMGLQREVNLFVAPDRRWLGIYVPALLRTYPFRFAPAADGGFALCIHEPMLASEGEQADPIFAAPGVLAGSVNEVVEMLRQVEGSRQQARRAATALAEHGVLAPLAQPVVRGGQPQALDGLWTIDEAALERLPDEVCGTLLRLGALGMAYDQLLSMGHWPALLSLRELKQRHHQELERRAAEIYSTPEDGDLEIDWSRFKV